MLHCDVRLKSPYCRNMPSYNVIYGFQTDDFGPPALRAGPVRLGAGDDRREICDDSSCSARHRASDFRLEESRVKVLRLSWLRGGGGANGDSGLRWPRATGLTTLVEWSRKTQTGLYVSRRADIARIPLLGRWLLPPAAAVFQVAPARAQALVMFAATPPRRRSANHSSPGRGLSIRVRVYACIILHVQSSILGENQVRLTDFLASLARSSVERSSKCVRTCVLASRLKRFNSVHVASPAGACPENRQSSIAVAGPVAPPLSTRRPTTVPPHTERPEPRAGGRSRLSVLSETRNVLYDLT
ncbi:hypothetical protein EVAR_36733_1 [Eumeta japonica]|uniref:Uncharacterized protein n=1 Tax=Eumeta variegata TaxID=151549 RepID=A0A4C1WZX4_EUMVA|nr:hypothetical protein EVAR_36733_1 [Eumeta japonica]